MFARLQSDTFFRRYVIYFSGSMVVAFFNYAFHPILGRLLSPSEFGDVQALISLLAQSAIILSAFSVIVVNVTTNSDHDTTLTHQRNAIIAELQKIAFWIVGVAFVVLLATLPELQTFFNFSTLYPLIGVIIILPISAIVTFRNAFLQGSGRFTELSIGGVISAVGRLVFAVGGIVIGWGVFGATAGIILANAAVLAYVWYTTRATLSLHVPANIHVLEKGSIKKELIYGVLVFFATGLVTLFYTIDVLIVKRHFSSDEAGLYSGISAIAKIIFFAIGPSSAVLLSSVKLKQSFTENAAYLKKSLLVAALIGGGALFTFYMFSGIIVSLMIGSRYGVYAHFLPLVGLVMFLTAVMNVFVFYFLALRRFVLIIVSLIGAALLLGILFTIHDSIHSVIWYLAAALGFINTLLIALYAKNYFNYRTGL